MGETHTQCPHCGFVYTVTGEQAAAMAGRSFVCASCGGAFTLSPAGAAFAQPNLTYASGAHVKGNPLAITSLISGCVLCVPFVPGIVSIVTGAIGLRKTRDPAVTGKGLAIAGLVLGIINVIGWGGYFGLIFAIMVPSLGTARHAANQAKCQSQLRALGSAILLYSNENRGAYPDSFEQLYLTQDVTPEVFVCPSSDDTKATGSTPEATARNLVAGDHLSYVYLGKGMSNAVSASTVVAYEPLSNHGSGAHVLFGNGSVQFIRSPQADHVIAQLEAGENPPSAASPSLTSPVPLPSTTGPGLEEVEP